ncbi:AMP-binding protein [Brevibacillus humidisoli]|uniref:AMP-binding protein n=1 Tax=Brevibacillus humidisoli TaxID=2895522 RepID=UPI001E57C373|nr:AMP-binding protein [Brevibacillus humidisoli]UFJ42495.1 AMP-binding protein [Brevibacillus humidisoli]
MSRIRPIAWEPTEEIMQKSNLQQFMDRHNIPDYQTLLSRSEQDIDWFWDAFVQFAGIQFYQPYTQIVDLTEGLPWPKWFVDGKINLVHNFLDKWADDPQTSARTALLWEGEDGTSKQYSFADLQKETNRFANVLTELGIVKGDRVAIYMPMIPETVIALYGIYKAGAVAVPLFSGFGPDAVALRLADVEAKAVVTADGFLRGGQAVPLKQVLDKAVASVPGVQAVIVAERLGDADYLEGRDYRWSRLISSASDRFTAVQTDAEDICMASYSSGTTGNPKGIVHVHGGIAVKTAEVGIFLYDTKPDDVVFMITDFGWMMGQLPLFSAHAVAAPYLIYEGSPVHPHPGRLYSIMEKYRVSSFGAPATALRLLKTYAEPFRQKADLSSLRMLGHTGEPIDEETWLWFLSWAEGRAPIINGSGGTEVFAEIISSVCVQPQKPTCLGQTPAVAAKVVDEQGNPVPAGQPGYLVFTVPQPAQTRGFWKDRQRYLDSYFSLGEQMWWQGDMVMVDEDGYWYHLGRADDVIKVSGRRTGPGEIEDVVNQYPGVLESAVIGVPHSIKGEELIVFAVVVPGSDVAADGLRKHVADSLGKPYEPSEIHLVQDLPKTRTQKIMRRLIKQRFLGLPMGDTSSLMNPLALDMLPCRSGNS